MFQHNPDNWTAKGALFGVTIKFMEFKSTSPSHSKLSLLILYVCTYNVQLRSITLWRAHCFRARQSITHIIHSILGVRKIGKRHRPPQHNPPNDDFWFLVWHAHTAKDTKADEHSSINLAIGHAKLYPAYRNNDLFRPLPHTTLFPFYFGTQLFFSRRPIIVGDFDPEAARICARILQSQSQQIWWSRWLNNTWSDTQKPTNRATSERFIVIIVAR